MNRYMIADGRTGKQIECIAEHEGAALDQFMQAGYAPGQIAAITFTNKAAAEMRERAKALIGARAAKPLVVSTFHSLGVRLLREDGQRVGLKPQFSILDSDDVLGILKDAGGSTDNALARRWQWAISGWKNQGLSSGQVEPVQPVHRWIVRCVGQKPAVAFLEQFECFERG